MRKLFVLLFFGVIATAGAAWGASVHVTMTQVDSVGVGNIIGMIVFQDSLKGLKIMPNLRDLTEGQHGIHVHENPSCEPTEKDGKMVPGLAAGGHFDPGNTGRHEGPNGQGHLGDLAVLYVNSAGEATRSSDLRAELQEIALPMAEALPVITQCVAPMRSSREHLADG